MYFHFVTNTYLEKAGFSFSWEGKHTLINQNFKKVIHAFKLNYEKSQHIMAKPLNIIFWCEYADNSYNLWIYSTFWIVVNNAKLKEIHFGKLFFVQCVEGSLIRQPELWNFRSLVAFIGTTWTVGSSSGNRRESVSPSPSQSSTFSKRLRTEDV